jgi:hypothetical protein
MTKASTARQNPSPSTALPPLDQPTRTMLMAFRPVLEEHLEDLVSAFLNYATAWPEMRSIASSPQAMYCFRQAQGRHLLNLFSGTFDEGYFARVSQMGEAHERAGLEPRWYLGAYGHVLKRLVELAIESCGTDAQRLLATVSAINRVVELDMACAVATLDATPVPGPGGEQKPPEGFEGLGRALIAAGASPSAKKSRL